MFPNLVDDESDSSSSAASRSPSVQTAQPAVQPPLPVMQQAPKPHQRPIAKVINFEEVKNKNPELEQEPQPEDAYPLPSAQGVLGPGQNTGLEPAKPRATGPTPEEVMEASATAFYFRFLLVPKYCGAIIGRAGANINQLSSQTGIHVQINQYTPPMGHEVAARDILREVIVTGGGPNVRMGILEMYKLLLNDAQELTIKVLIAPDQVPRIMGKNGHTMAKLREMAGCKIRLLNDQEGAFYEPDRVLLLEGPTLMCGNACAMLVELFADMPSIPLPDPNPSAGGMDHAPRGTKRPSSQMNPHANVPTGPLPVTTDVASHMPSIATTTIGLNKTQASMIIGRGGCTINQVRQMTNARVMVEERPDGNRDLILSGPLDQVEAGLNLVRQVFMTESYDDEKPQPPAPNHFGAIGDAPAAEMSGFGMPGMPPMLPGGIPGMLPGGMAIPPFGFNPMGAPDFGYGPVGQ